MYRRGYNFRHRFLFLSKFASIAVEENGEAGSREVKKWLIFAEGLLQNPVNSSYFLTSKLDTSLYPAPCNKMI